MAEEEQKKQGIEKKDENKIVEASKSEENIEEKKKESIEASPKEEKKKEKLKEDKGRKSKVKKNEAIVNAYSIPISTKHAVSICKFIKNNKIDEAINNLEEVKKFKKVVPFKGEIPHRKGKGIMSGRYPVKAASLFINVLKGLRWNILVNGLDLDKTKIYYASASWGRRPLRKGNRQAKRTNVIFKAKEYTENQRFSVPSTPKKLASAHNGGRNWRKWKRKNLLNLKKKN